MNSKTKILYIQSTFEVESPSLLLWYLCRFIDKDKYQILACCMRKGGPYEDKLRDLGIQVKNFNMKCILDLRVIFKLIKFIRENEVDIVHTSIRLADWYGRVSAKLAGVPLIFSTIHNTDYWRRERKYIAYSILDRLLLAFNTHIVAVSYGVKNFLVRWQSVNPDKITVIHNGIDVEEFTDSTSCEKLRDLFGLQSNVPTVGFTGRIERQKGLHILLHAARNIVQSGRQVQFLIVGDGSLRRELESIAKKLEIEQHVIFTGFRSDRSEVLTILRFLDIFVMPSLWEGLGLSIIEAMLAGKPVVASKIDGIPEVVLDQETGILVPPREPKALADAICTLLDSPEKRREMGERGRQHAIRHFSIDRMVRDYEEFYDSYTGDTYHDRLRTTKAIRSQKQNSQELHSN